MRSFYLKLAVIFSGLLIAFGMLVAYTSTNASLGYVQETTQKSNANLARTLAQEFRPLLKDTIDHKAIRDKIQQLSGTNPQFDIYLLNRQGVIKGSYPGSGDNQRTPVTQVVDTRPIDQYLSGDPLPILGQDPLQNNRSKPFSAAPISIKDSSGCYLYIILEGQQYDQTAALVSDSYIIGNTMWILGIIFLITLFIGLFLFKMITQRLQTIKQTVTAFERGQLHRRIPRRGNDELSDLSYCFNQMADTIVQNMDDLKKTDKLRRELVANISHDLRSPLSSIQGYLETIQIKGQSIGKDEYQKYFDIVLKNTQKLNRLISDLFELSKLDAEDVKPELEYVSMAELVQDLVIQFKPIAEEKHVKLEASFPNEPTSLVYADLGLMERALSNLIDNAIKHTESGGSVSIASAKDGKDVMVEIKDSGKGIPEKDIPHIFDRFYQVDKSRSPGAGAGLGLSIAQKILQLHGAKVSIESMLNKGTTFRIFIPGYPV